MSEAISLGAVQSLAKQVARRYWISGFDRADLEQELVLHAHEHALPKINLAGKPEHFVRVCMVNKARRLLEHSNRFCRAATIVVPRDELAFGASSVLNPEECMLLSEGHNLLAVTQPYLDSLGGARMEVFSDEVRESIEREEQSMGDSDLPECHIEVNKTLGYDPNDVQCPGCPKKFTCLPGSIDAGTLEATVDVDPEVKAVQSGLITEEEILARLVKRQSYVTAGQRVPAALALKVTERQLRDAHSDKRARHRYNNATIEAPTYKPKPKKKRLRRVRDQPELPPVQNVSREEHLKDDPNKRTFRSGRALPKVKELSGERMREKLKEVNAMSQRGGRKRFPFDLEIGMELVLHLKSGKEVAVQITDNGFAWQGECYTSISTAFCHALGRSVSGFDLFDMKRRKNCEIRGATVPGRSFHYGRDL